jgi:hypothetical protein
LVPSQLLQQWVFIPFHWVFEAEEERKERKKGKRERLREIKHIFFALLNPLYIDLLVVAV